MNQKSGTAQGAGQGQKLQQRDQQRIQDPSLKPAPAAPVTTTN